jgi:hypothetical protein
VVRKVLVQVRKGGAAGRVVVQSVASNEQGARYSVVTKHTVHARGGDGKRGSNGRDRAWAGVEAVEGLARTKRKQAAATTTMTGAVPQRQMQLTGAGEAFLAWAASAATGSRAGGEARRDGMGDGDGGWDGGWEWGRRW